METNKRRRAEVEAFRAVLQQIVSGEAGAAEAAAVLGEYPGAQRAVLSLAGQTFGRLTVLKRTDDRGRGVKSKWVCRCVCGEETTVVGTSLVSGKTRSCGCLGREKLQAHYARVRHVVRSIPSRHWVEEDA